MKMVILEVADGYAAALADDGSVSRIPDQNYRVGQTLVCADQKKQRGFTFYAKRMAAVAAVFILLLVGFGVLQRMPVTYVSLDVNPSVEYKLNIWNQVVEAVAVNQDAEELLKDTQFINQSADEAIRQTIELLSENDYLTAGEKNGIVISATGSVAQKSKQVLGTVAQVTEQTTQSIGVAADIIVIESSMSDLKQAEKLGTTPGKMLLVNEIVETDLVTIDPETDVEQMKEVEPLLQSSVKELVSMISEDGLTQMSQSNASVIYIPSGWTDADSSSSSDLSEASVGDTDSTDDSAEADTSVGSSSTPSSSKQESSCVSEPTTSQPNDSNVSSSEGSESESSASSMNVDEIPAVNPGASTSSTQENDSNSDRENAPSTGTASDKLDSSAIPSVRPGAGVSDTSDEWESKQENSPEETTSAPEAEEDTASEEVEDGSDTVSEETVE